MIGRKGFSKMLMLLSPVTFLLKKYFTRFKQLLGKKKIKCSERCPFFGGIHSQSENFLGKRCHQWHCSCIDPYTDFCLLCWGESLLLLSCLKTKKQLNCFFLQYCINFSYIWYANRKPILKNWCRGKHISCYINQKDTVENWYPSFSLLRKIKPKNKGWISEVQNEILNESMKKGH